YLPTDNLNDGHLEYMFFTVGAVSVVNVIAFVWVMKKMNFGMDAIAVEDENEYLVSKDSVMSRESMAAIK
ncbi:hypothetical protein Gpo141_00014580, partial [Globisporangium polare]